jgi:DNA-directed RNA polymerase omega subunit
LDFELLKVIIKHFQDQQSGTKGHSVWRLNFFMEENLDNNELNLDENNNGSDIGEDSNEETPIPNIDSKYRMILLAAQRSKQLQRGADSRVSTDIRKTKPTRIAMEEIRQKKVRFKILDQE